MPLPLLALALGTGARAALPHVGRWLGQTFTKKALGAGARSVGGKTLKYGGKYGSYAGAGLMGYEALKGVSSWLGAQGAHKSNPQFGPRVYNSQMNSANRGVGTGYSITGSSMPRSIVGSDFQGRGSGSYGMPQINDMSAGDYNKGYNTIMANIPQIEKFGVKDAYAAYDKVKGDFGGGTTIDQTRINRMLDSTGSSVTDALKDWMPTPGDADSRGQTQAAYETAKAVSAQEKAKSMALAGYAGAEGIISADAAAQMRNQRADQGDAVSRLANQLGGAGTYSSGAGVKDMAALEAIGQRDLQNLRGQTNAQIAAIAGQRAGTGAAFDSQIGDIGAMEGQLAQVYGNQALDMDRGFMLDATSLKEQARMGDQQLGMQMVGSNQNQFGQAMAGLGGFLNTMNDNQGLQLTRYGMGQSAMSDIMSNNSANTGYRMQGRGQNMDYNLSQEANRLGALQGNQDIYMTGRGQDLDAALGNAQLNQNQAEMDAGYNDTVNSQMAQNVIQQAQASGQDPADMLQQMLRSAKSPSQRAAIAQALSTLQSGG